MRQFREDSLIAVIRNQLRPAVGCTEPAAAAYAAAVAAQALGRTPELLRVTVSRNILKNAMGVGIPGTDMVGLPIAIALGALCGDADAALSVLHRVSDEDVRRARFFVDEHRVQVALEDTEHKLYIDVRAQGGGHSSRAVIQGAHTHLSLVEKDGTPSRIDAQEAAHSSEGTEDMLSFAQIDHFVRTVSADQLAFLRECIDMNAAIAREGLAHPYGMVIGRSLWENHPTTEEAIATAFTCAAADARMGGCTLPVMSCCGSGNQGLTASLPVIAVARKRRLTQEETLRALCYSVMVTIHVKRHLGRLSALCACSVGASIGTACALAYLNGGGPEAISRCVSNVVADVAGVICDGAKAGCSLKIATGVTCAFRAAMLALKNHGATVLDGIVGADAEASVDNLAILCNTGMQQTDRVILDMLVCK